MALIDAGFPEEAFGMSRTMVEIALNLRFITNRNSEQRAKRFVHYLSRWKLEILRRSLKHFYIMDPDGKFVFDAKGNRISKYTKPQLRKMMGDYKMHARIARKYPKRTSWTDTGHHKMRGGAWMMAMETDRYDSISGVPVKWEFDYDWMYFWTSQYVHATVVSMEPAHATLPTHPFMVRKPFQETKRIADLAVFTTAVQLNKSLVMAFRALGHPFHSDIADPLGAFIVKMVKEDPGKQQL
jgi:hypothetical protein